MLILSRRVNEQILIKDDSGDVIVTLTLSKISHGGQVKIGFEADAKYKIDRPEVHAKRNAEAS